MIFNCLEFTLESSANIAKNRLRKLRRCKPFLFISNNGNDVCDRNVSVYFDACLLSYFNFDKVSKSEIEAQSSKRIVY